MCVYCVCACCVCGLQNCISGACKDKTVGMCSWSNVHQTGSLPLPKSGANGDMYVREALPQASAHLLPGLCEQNGVLRGTARPGPLLAVGPRSPALAVSGTAQVLSTLTGAAALACPLWEPHTHRRAASPVSLLSEAGGHEKTEAVEKPETGVSGRASRQRGSPLARLQEASLLWRARPRSPPAPLRAPSAVGPRRILGEACSPGDRQRADG